MARVTPESLFLRGLDRPEFVATDPQALTQDIIDAYEALLERKLYPAQVERLQANLQAYREVEVRFGIQFTGEQMLVAFATDLSLDYLGQLLGEYRLSESPSEVILRFTYDVSAAEALPEQDIVIDKGVEVSIAKSSYQLRWLTSQSAIIRGANEGGHDSFDEGGNPYVDVPASCNTTGTISNGFQPGEINTIIKTIPYVSAQNITQSRQGSPSESDERFKERILLAPYRFSGGHINAYKAYARAVSVAISDVGIHIPTPGRVQVHPLTSGGIPGDALLLSVAEALHPERANRPLTDDVLVLPPVEVPYAIRVRIWVYKGALQGATRDDVARQINRYWLERQPRVGRDIVPSQINDAVMNVQNVYRCIVEAPSYRRVESYEWAHLISTDIVIEGEELG